MAGGLSPAGTAEASTTATLPNRIGARVWGEAPTRSLEPSEDGRNSCGWSCGHSRAPKCRCSARSRAMRLRKKRSLGRSAGLPQPCLRHSTRSSSRIPALKRRAISTASLRDWSRTPPSRFLKLNAISTLLFESRDSLNLTPVGRALRRAPLLASASYSSSSARRSKRALPWRKRLMFLM